MEIKKSLSHYRDWISSNLAFLRLLHLEIFLRYDD